VYIPEMPGSVDNDPATWHTVSYMSPFYGVTSGNPNADTGPGEFINGRQSYGFWATAPDEGSSVIAQRDLQALRLERLQQTFCDVLTGIRDG
jgi:hypothetical protein